MIRLLFLMCISLIVVLSVSAQTPSNPEADATSAQTTSVESKPKPTAKPTDSSDTQDNGKAKSGGQVFRPSEEISEDSPVPFPVDI